MSRAALLLLALLLTPAPAAAQELVLSVAVSMKEAVEELARGFTAGRPGVLLRFNVGASGELQKQIEAGAPVDLFVSAAQRQMDELEKAGLIVPSSRRAFARNALTVIKPTDSRIDISKSGDLLDPRVKRIVIGNPRTVPVGQYSEESLRAFGLWERVQPRLVLAENVRQALDYVVRGEVDAGFVYTTDAATRVGRVTEALRPPEDTYRPIVYPAAVMAACRQRVLAQSFIDFLVSREGQMVLRRLGFQPAPPGAR